MKAGTKAKITALLALAFALDALFNDGKLIVKQLKILDS